MEEIAPSLAQWLAIFVKIFADAAAALPLIIALGLVAGRRGNGRFCLWASEKLLGLALPLSFAGPAYILLRYFSLLLPYNTRGASLLAPLLESSGMAYTSSIIAWTAGALALYLAQGALAPALFRHNAETDRYKLSFIKFPLALCLLAAFVFFLTFILLNWPFAGLPQNLDWPRAAMAVCRNAVRHYFMAFCPAGAIALLYAFHVYSGNCPASEAQKHNSLRWCAIWAAIGYLPYSLQKWGLALGLALRGNADSLMGSIASQILALSLLAMAIVCWFWLFFCKKQRAAIAWTAFGLFTGGSLCPFLAHYF